MFSRGVIVTMHGWALERAGHDVEFYVWPGRTAAYGEVIDLDLLNARRRPWGSASSTSGRLIVLSVRHYRLAEAADFLTPSAGKATVLLCSNIWTEPLPAIGAPPIDQIAWGFLGASSVWN